MSTAGTAVAYDSRVATRTEPVVTDSTKTEAFASGVSWAAVAAGAFVTAALSLVLLALGAGAGLSTLSPWSNSNISPSAVGVGALIFLALVEIIASGIGGYMAGRLRTKWVNVHTDEVYFRDTRSRLPLLVRSFRADRRLFEFRRGGYGWAGNP